MSGPAVCIGRSRTVYCMTFPPDPTSTLQPTSSSPEPKSSGGVSKKAIAAGVFGLLVVVGAITGGGSDPETAEAPATTEAAAVVEETTTTEAAAVVEETTTTTEDPLAGFTPAQQQAIGSAESYLEFSNFSETGLIGQLEYEQFSTEDATVAVNHLNVDWTQQAIGSAEDYLDFSSFSRTGLVGQLSSEYGDEYTAEQAEAAVSSIEADVDWLAEAAEAAASYIEFSNFSCGGLTDQLASEYGDEFTPEQAAHGAQTTGICG